MTLQINSIEKAQFEALIIFALSLKNEELVNYSTLLHAASNSINDIFASDGFKVILKDLLDKVIVVVKGTQKGATITEQEIRAFLNNILEVYSTLMTKEWTVNQLKQAKICNALAQKLLEELTTLKFDNSEEDNKKFLKLGRLQVSNIIKKVNEYSLSNNNNCSTFDNSVAELLATKTTKMANQTKPSDTFWSSWRGWAVFSISILAVFFGPLAVLLLPQVTAAVGITIGVLYGCFLVAQFAITAYKVSSAHLKYNIQLSDYENGPKLIQQDYDNNMTAACKKMLDATDLDSFLEVDDVAANQQVSSDVIIVKNSNSSAISLGDNPFSTYGATNGTIKTSSTESLNNNNAKY